FLFSLNSLLSLLFFSSSFSSIPETKLNKKTLAKIQIHSPYPLKPPPSICRQVLRFLHRRSEPLPHVPPPSVEPPLNVEVAAAVLLVVSMEARPPLEFASHLSVGLSSRRRSRKKGRRRIIFFSIRHRQREPSPPSDAGESRPSSQPVPLKDRKSKGSRFPFVSSFFSFLVQGFQS
ncbi:hypothetical protein LINPERPRIM_LOCUS38415, partial [Linum perenne]